MTKTCAGCAAYNMKDKNKGQCIHGNMKKGWAYAWGTCRFWKEKKSVDTEKKT